MNNPPEKLLNLWNFFDNLQIKVKIKYDELTLLKRATSDAFKIYYKLFYVYSKKCDSRNGAICKIKRANRKQQSATNHLCLASSFCPIITKGKI